MEVRIGGARACTDGNTIWLPALPLDDAQAAALGFGLLFHETNHLRYTDFSVAKGEGLVGTLTNALEDVRIDALGQQEYRGGHREEEELVAALIRRGEAKTCAEGDHPARILETYLMWRLEHDLLGIDAARDMARQAEQVFRQTFAPDVQATLDALMFRVRDCHTTCEVQALARTITHALAAEERAEELPQAHTRVRPNATTPACATALQRALQGPPGGHARGIGELAQAAVNAKGQETPQLNLTMPKSAPSRATQGVTMTAAFALQARAASHALQQRLSGLLQAQTLCRRYPAATGRRLDLRRLGRIEAGNTLPFMREGPGLKTDTAVQILLDRSGSMGSSRGREKSGARPIEVAREACYAAALALRQVPGVAVAAAAFPGHGEHEVAVLARFHERLERGAARFASVEAGGATPLAEALLWGGAELLAQREARRIVLVATDGAYDEKRGCAMTARLDAAGIESLGIGIHCDVARLFARSRSIATIADLPQAIFELLREALPLTARNS